MCAAQWTQWRCKEIVQQNLLQIIVMVLVGIIPCNLVEVNLLIIAIAANRNHIDHQRAVDTYRS